MNNHDLCNLAWQKLAEGQNVQAGRLFAQVLSADAEYPAALHGMGYLAWITRQVPQAIDLLLRATRADSQRAEAYLHLGAAYHDAGDVERAIEAVQRAIQLDGSKANYHASLATGLAAMQRLPDALASYRRALELEPRNIDFLIDTSAVLRVLDEAPEAEALARRALAVDPSHLRARRALAAALEVQDDLPGAEAAYRAALQLDPANANLHLDLATVLMTAGRLTEGFAEYESRFAAKGIGLNIESLPTPRWHGSNLSDKTLLVQCEQGLGDTIHFSRFLPEAAKRCGRVIFRCQPTLVRLIASGAFENVQVIPDGSPAPPHDVHLPLLSLGHVVGTTLETIPARVPYLHADPSYIERWRDVLPPREPGEIRVGLTFQGSPTHVMDRVRSLDPAALAPLADVKRVRWFSLHKDPIKPAVAAPPLMERPPAMRDLDWAAALLMQLDLILTVDTSMAHLAGALGRPVWVMLATRSDWRWMLERTDSPWYPTMRLFRQKQPRNWSNVIEEVCRELTQAVAAQGRS